MNHELSLLLNAAADGTLAPEDAARLRELLAEIEGADADFGAFMDLHLAVAEREAPVRPFSIEELRAVADVEARFEKSDEAWVSPRSPAATSPARLSPWLWFGAGLAASLLAFAPFTRWTSQPDADPVVAQSDSESTANKSTETEQPPQESAVARITRKIDCVWQSDRWMVSPPTSFRVGDPINLNSGLLALRFESGAEVTLRGPARASIVSSNSMNLESGGLTANVPESARGFTVNTSSGEVIDLGTQFGVMAGEDGSMETHVFEGEVIARTTTGARGAPRAEASILAGEAQLLSSAGAATKARAQPNRFLQLDFGLGERGIEPPPVTDRVALWLAGDGRVQLDEDGGVVAWGDNPIDHQTAITDSWQLLRRKRPQLVEDAINGRPAVRFHTSAGLVSEPFSLGSDVTVAIAFQLSADRVPGSFRRIRNNNPPKGDRRPDLGIQLVNLWGPPHPVVQINEDLSLTARVHLGFDPDNIYHNDIGVTKQRAPLDDAPHVIAYTFDATRGTARLLLDGTVIEEVPIAEGMAPTYGPRFIGHHPHRRFHSFLGDVGEILIYDQALSPPEAGRVSEWLCQKYGIPAAGPQAAE